MKRLIIFFLLLAAGGAAAQLSTTRAGKGTPAAAYIGPGDLVSGATAWYGFRAYSAAVAATGTQKAANVRRASDNETCDFLITTAGIFGLSANCSGADNNQTLATFLTSTTGTVTKAYDQSGNSRDVAQATAANQPSILASGCGFTASAPCMSSASSSITLTGPAFTPAAGGASFSVVGRRSTNNGSCNFIFSNANNRDAIVTGNAVSNQWIIRSTPQVVATASDGSWHAGNAVQNAASSVFNIDGTETTGTSNLDTTAGSIGLQNGSGAGGTVCRIAEAGFWDNKFFSSGNRTSMCSNQFTYWGTAASC